MRRANIVVRKTLMAGLTACLGLTIAGCAITKDHAGTYARLEEDKGKVVFGTPGFAGPTTLRVGFVDFNEREEYALFRSSGGQAETVFVEARTDRRPQTVIEFDKLIEQTVPMFRFNQGQQIQWSESRWVETSFKGAWARPYRLAGSGHACVGFAAAWDRRPDDPMHRPSKAVFGYACKPNGQNMEEAEAEAIVRAVDLRGITMPLRIKSAYDLEKDDPPPLPRERQVELLVQAQDGAPGGRSGVPEFPLLIARGFTMLDSDVFPN